ncbi:putative Vesicle-fusing ATPase [Paratrimastix pyriformis]|uniref:Vesicle-fusing ATPase n=1 Tax=Paratrimastix pyriformis TaxID=342808 RepID=A0ABQ8U9R8_9EUKA|nr:putative Vesicle-fusing ATPase [Paratrimastix pyriformis]
MEIGLPDEQGRQQILRIHTSKLRESECLGEDVDLAEVAHETKNYSGAELEGVVKAAVSHALFQRMDLKSLGQALTPEMLRNIKVTQQDFRLALTEVRSHCLQVSHGCMSGVSVTPLTRLLSVHGPHGAQVIPLYGVDREQAPQFFPYGMIPYGPAFDRVMRAGQAVIRMFHSTPNSMTYSLLLEGDHGAGKTAIAAMLAKESEFPFHKIITPKDITSRAAGDAGKVQLLNKWFDDSFKSKMSMLVLDDFEKLIELSHSCALTQSHSLTIAQSHSLAHCRTIALAHNQLHHYTPTPRFSNPSTLALAHNPVVLSLTPHTHSTGPRFSNPILQCLQAWMAYTPQAGHKLLIVSTTSCYEKLRTYEMADGFTEVIHVPCLASPADMEAVLKVVTAAMFFVTAARDCLDDADAHRAAADLSSCGEIPMKKLLSLIQRAQGEKSSTATATTPIPSPAPSPAGTPAPCRLTYDELMAQFRLSRDSVVCMPTPFSLQRDAAALAAQVGLPAPAATSTSTM